MKMLELAEKYSMIISLGFLTIGLLILAGAAHASIEAEVSSFADTLLNILHGPLGKVLATAAFIGCGISLFTGKYGMAACCFMAGILFGFAKQLAEAVFR